MLIGFVLSTRRIVWRSGGWNMTKAKVSPSSMGLPWVDVREMSRWNGMLVCSRRITGLFFSEVSCGQFRKNGGSCSRWMQIITAAFVGQEHRGMQSLCTGYAEGVAAPCRGWGRAVLSRLRAAAIAQLNGVAPFSTGYFLSQKAQEQQAASLQKIPSRKQH